VIGECQLGASRMRFFELDVPVRKLDRASRNGRPSSRFDTAPAISGSNAKP